MSVGEAGQPSRPSTSTDAFGCSRIELRHLEHAHAQQRVEQQRQHGDHEQRAPIEELIAYLAAEDESDVGPVHGASHKPYPGGKA